MFFLNIFKKLAKFREIYFQGVDKILKKCYTFDRSLISIRKGEQDGNGKD